MDAATKQNSRDEFIALARAMSEPSDGLLLAGVPRPIVSRDALAHARRAFPDASEDELYESAAEYDLLSTDARPIPATVVPWRIATFGLGLAVLLLAIAYIRVSSP